MKKLLGFALGLALGAGAVIALAQPVVQNQFSGTECWNAGQGPGGPSTGFLCLGQVRNGTGLNIFSGSGAFTTQATTANSTLFWHSTAPTTWTITTPTTPFDGELITLATDTTLTTMVTLTAATGSTLNAAYTNQTLTAATSVEWQYNFSAAIWYRIR
jgi:hypothetical protein